MDYFDAVQWSVTHDCYWWKCVVEEAVNDEIFDAAASAGVEGAVRLEKLINDSDGSISFNAERGAVQAEGCRQGQISIHIPLDAETQRALAQRLQHAGS